MVQKAVANPARLSYQGEALFSISFPLFMLPVSFLFPRLRFRFRFSRLRFRFAFHGSDFLSLFTPPVPFRFYGSGFASLSAAPDVIVLP